MLAAGGFPQNSKQRLVTFVEQFWGNYFRGLRNFLNTPSSIDMAMLTLFGSNGQADAKERIMMVMRRPSRGTW